MFGKGSTFAIHSETGFDIGRLDGAWIGERVMEGYGELQVKEWRQSADVRVRKRREEKADTCGAAQSDIVKKLLQSEFERRIQEHVRGTLAEKKNSYRNRAEA